MTSQIAAIPAPRSRDISAPSFVRLTEIELRKGIDTRSGFWLLAATLALTVVAAFARAMTGDQSDHTFRAVLEMALAPTNVLLPVACILLVTAEWSQRTALSSFALVPDRLRLLGAKFAAGLVLGFAFFVPACIVSAVAVAIFGADAPGAWSFGVEMWLQFLLFVAIGMAMGIALGAACLASAPAIVTYFAAPTVITMLASFKSLESALEWVDPAATSTPLTDGPLTSSGASHLLTATLAWVVLPLAIGVWRIRRADID